MSWSSAIRLPSSVRPAAASRRPLSWPVVGIVVAALVAVLAVLTLYLPAREANVVRVQDLTVRLTAQPNQAYHHGIGLNVLVEPDLPSDAWLEVTPTMPTMGNMQAATTNVTRSGAGEYAAVSDLGMAGLWQVAVIIHRPGRSDAVARFRVTA
jgi:hypothetical protein